MHKQHKTQIMGTRLNIIEAVLTRTHNLCTVYNKNKKNHTLHVSKTCSLEFCLCSCIVYLERERERERVL